MPKSSIPQTSGIAWKNQGVPVITSTKTVSETDVPHLSILGSGYLQCLTQTLTADFQQNSKTYLKLTVDGVVIFDSVLPYIDVTVTNSTDGVGTSAPIFLQNLRFNSSLLIEHRVFSAAAGTVSNTISAYSLDL